MLLGLFSYPSKILRHSGRVGFRWEFDSIELGRGVCFILPSWDCCRVTEILFPCVCLGPNVFLLWPSCILENVQYLTHASRAWPTQMFQHKLVFTGNEALSYCVLSLFHQKTCWWPPHCFHNPWKVPSRESVTCTEPWGGSKGSLVSGGNRFTPTQLHRIPKQDVLWDSENWRQGLILMLQAQRSLGTQLLLYFLFPGFLLQS